MSYADRVKETSTTTGTGAIALAGAATGFRAFAAGFAVNATMPYAISDALGNWEIGTGTLSASTTLARTTVLASSNGNALVNFPSGSKDVFCTLSAAQISAFQVSQDIAFSATIPLTVAGTQYMPQQSVSSVLAFTVASSPVKGASVYVRLLADGANAPTFTGMKEWGGSLGYDNRNQIANQIQFFYDGYDSWYSISQAVGAVATPAAASVVTMSGPTSGVASTASNSFTVGANGTITGTVVVTPSDASGGGTFSPTSVSLSSGAPTGTFTYTPNSTVTTRTISVTNNGGLSNPTSISYSVLAAPTVPGAPTIGTATGGDASAVVTFTAPGSTGGSAILDYTVTASTGQTATGAASPITVTGLANGAAVTFTVKARNSVGSSVASAASNSVTPAAAVATALQFGSLLNVAESGTSPNYTYTGTSGAGTYGGSAVLNKAFQAGVDGEIILRVQGKAVDNTGGFHGVTTTNNVTDWHALSYGQWVNPNTSYSTTENGSLGSCDVNVSVAIGDLMRMKRVGSVLTLAVSKDSGSTWTALKTWTGVPTGAYYITTIYSNGYAVNQLSSTGLA